MVLTTNSDGYTARNLKRAEEVREDELGGSSRSIERVRERETAAQGGDKENEDGRAGPEALYRFSGALHAWMMCRVL
jgi:hypothetical protein